MNQSQVMDFPSTVDYVLSFADYERLSRSAVVFDLARVQHLLDRLGNPHLGTPSVHIAGTKGKGSTAAMIASILTESGFRTGLYTSPHLLTIRERIQIDSLPISEDKFASLVNQVRPHIEAANALSGLGELTTFEILTALAFLHFKTSGVDYQVLETGLGGRLDATNVIVPEVSVITGISYDHMEVLGDTISKIATEKAGIIKHGVPVISAPQAPEAGETIAATCCEKGAELVLVGSDVTWKTGTFGTTCQSFEIRTRYCNHELALPLFGEYQVINAACAVAAAETLARKNSEIAGPTIARGLAQVKWPGRLQVLAREPLFLVDGAHNDDSSRKLMQAIRHYFRFDELWLLVGLSSEKNLPAIIRELAKATNKVIVTRSDHPRATGTELLLAEFAKHGITAGVAADTGTAIRLAYSKASHDDAICATGSLFIVSEVLQHFAAESL